MTFIGPISACGTSRSGTSLQRAAPDKNARAQIAGETHYFDDLRVTLGGFDEQYFMYAEEVDLCKRIADGGGTLLCDPRIRMLHDTGNGDGRAPSRLLNLTRGNATFYRKHFGPVWSFVCRTLLLAHACTRLVFGIISRSKGHREGFGAVVRRRSEWWHGWPRTASHSEAP